MIVTGASMAAVVLGGAERLRWTIAEIPYLDVPSSSHVVATAMSKNGAVTGRSGSTLSSVGWHAFVWTPTEGMQQCADDGWALSLGQAINDAHTVAGSVNTCPSDNGPCSTAPAILQLDDEAQLIGPLLQEYAYVQGITEAGHIVYEQSTGELWESGGWVNMPDGDSIALPMPDEAWSVDLGKPVFLDKEPNNLLIPGYAWMSPARQPMVWRVDLSNSTVSATVLTGISGGEAHVILENGTVLGMLYVDGASVPVEWPYPWTMWSPLAEVDSK
ncbi:MAG: hypothetical protein MK100_06825, partial [Phycisphaerales bacterium]|nr:hypothetical protein [Phycisphaerales bacterium]